MDELGYAKSLACEEIGGTLVIRLEQDPGAGAVSTVVLRASTDQLLDDLERAVDDGVNTYKVRVGGRARRQGLSVGRVGQGAGVE